MDPKDNNKSDEPISKDSNKTSFIQSRKGVVLATAIMAAIMGIVGAMWYYGSSAEIKRLSFKTGIIYTRILREISLESFLHTQKEALELRIAECAEKYRMNDVLYVIVLENTSGTEEGIAGSRYKVRAKKFFKEVPPIDLENIIRIHLKDPCIVNEQDNFFAYEEQLYTDDKISGDCYSCCVKPEDSYGYVLVGIDKESLGFTRTHMLIWMIMAYVFGVVIFGNIVYRLSKKK